jgi:hypothetical protein
MSRILSVSNITRWYECLGSLLRKRPRRTFGGVAELNLGLGHGAALLAAGAELPDLTSSAFERGFQPGHLEPSNGISRSGGFNRRHARERQCAAIAAEELHELRSRKTAVRQANPGLLPMRREEYYLSI